MRRAVVDCLLGVVESHEAIDETRSERIAAANAVVDLEPRALDRLVQLSLVPADRRPVIHRRGLDRPKRRRDRLKIRVDRDGLLDHLLEALDRKRRKVLVHAFDLDAERRGEVFLVADHDINVLRDLAVNLLRLCLAADRLPERSAVVEVVARDGAVLLRGLESLDHDVGRSLRKRGVYAARVEPPDALLAEEPLPVDVAGLELAHRREPAVGAAPRPAASEAALDEVEPVPHRAPDAVVRHPLDVRHVHAALQHEVLHETPDGVVRERGDRRRLQAEAAPQAAHHVVLAAALPGAELAGGVDAPVAGIEAQHYLAKGRRVPHAGTGRLYVQRFGHCIPPFRLEKIRW